MSFILVLLDGLPNSSEREHRGGQWAKASSIAIHAKNSTHHAVTEPAERPEIGWPRDLKEAGSIISKTFQAVLNPNNFHSTPPPLTASSSSFIFLEARFPVCSRCLLSALPAVLTSVPLGLASVRDYCHLPAPRLRQLHHDVMTFRPVRGMYIRSSGVV